MSTRERSVLKRLVRRLHADADFARAVATDPSRALARTALTVVQQAAVASLAVALLAGAMEDDRENPGWW